MKLAHQPVPSKRHSNRAPPILSISAQKSHAKHRAVTPFRINTSISVASKRLYLSLESILMKKGGEGKGYTPDLIFRGARRSMLHRFISNSGGRMKRATVLGLVILAMAATCLPQETKTSATHTLHATPKTVVWGYYDAGAPPVLKVKSGETVEIETVITSSPKRLEEAGVPAAQVEQSLRDITKEVTNKGPGGHIL